MIYIDENTKTVKFPKVMILDAAFLICENQISHQVLTFNVIDSTPTKHYYTFELDDLSQFTDGQWNYKITNNDDIVLSEGILQYGDFVPEKTIYKENRNTIIYNG